MEEATVVYGRAARRASIALHRFGVCPGDVVDIEAALRRERVIVDRWPLGEAISGLFLREDEPVIAVNANHHSNRQRFTMAHEYYHYLYHRSLDHLICLTDLQDKRQCEREANRFAACLLMPEDIVRRMLCRYDLETTAERMMVSVEALQWRLRELGILEGMIA